MARKYRNDKFQFVVLKIQLNNPSKNRCYMEANKPCNSGFSLPFFFFFSWCRILELRKSKMDMAASSCYRRTRFQCIESFLCLKRNEAAVLISQNRRRTCGISAQNQPTRQRFFSFPVRRAGVFIMFSLLFIFSQC